jgi:hypothetical protein
MAALPGRLRANGVVSALFKNASVEELPRVNNYIASPHSMVCLSDRKHVNFR